MSHNDKNSKNLFHAIFTSLRLFVLLLCLLAWTFGFISCVAVNRNNLA